MDTEVSREEILYDFLVRLLTNVCVFLNVRRRFIVSTQLNFLATQSTSVSYALFRYVQHTVCTIVYIIKQPINCDTQLAFGGNFPTGVIFDGGNIRENVR